MYALVDADIICYRCGFAAQRTHYRLPNVDVEFSSAAECKTFCQNTGIDYSTKQPFAIIEPVENALHNVKTVLEDIIEQCEVGEGQMELWLSGPTNFRDSIGITRQYKGNRDPDHKPAWYKEIKDYLVDVWGAEYSDNCEADDMLAIKSCTENCIIVSTDKDLNQVEGWHYNWVTRKKYFVDKEGANYNFWFQMITGDPTDNIQGIPGMGDAKAVKFLDSLDPSEWELAVVNLYAESYPDTHRDVFLEHYKLIKLGEVPKKSDEIADISQTDTTS